MYVYFVFFFDLFFFCVFPYSEVRNLPSLMVYLIEILIFLSLIKCEVSLMAGLESLDVSPFDLFLWGAVAILGHRVDAACLSKKIWRSDCLFATLIED